MFTPKLKRNISKIVPFGIIWLLFGLIFLFVEYAAIQDCAYAPSGAISLDYKVFTFAILAVTFVGFFIGIIEVLFIKSFFAKRSLLTKMLGKFFIYTLFLFLIIGITYPIAASIELQLGVFDPRIWNKFFGFINSITFLSTGFQMLISLIASIFYTEISDHIGRGVFINFITGKYHKPKEERRIFMFLDMKSSTSIAEKLGHLKYFDLLQSYYHILSNALVDYYGEVYQYVGDEIVVSWKLKKGIKNNNCIACFFAMKKDLDEKSDWFEKKFGVCPTFKAGFHIGKVTTGEIGSIKKEIIFTGDVLNSTARIQNLCNEYRVDILLSETLVRILNLKKSFHLKFLGNKNLRGKEKPIKLYTLTKK